MEARHVRWAQQHDWYRRASYNIETGKWVVHAFNSCHTPDNTEPYEESFDDYKTMRNWAGY
jgi:hypothetical protein